MVGTPVAIVVPQNAQSLDISGPLDAFLEANGQAPGRCNYEVRLLSAGPDRSVMAGGMSLVTHGTIFEDEQPIDTMLVAGTLRGCLVGNHPVMSCERRRNSATCIGGVNG